MTILSPGLPVVVPAFGSIVFTFEVSLAGDTSFDAEATFTNTAKNFDIRFIGRRVLIFQGIPEEGITERITFGTDVMISENGKEQVMSWRRTPRSEVSFIVREEDDVRRTRLLTKLMGAGQLQHGLSLWWQARQPTAAALAADSVLQINTDDMEIAVGDTMGFILPDLSTFEGEVLSFTASAITFTQTIGTDVPTTAFVMPIKFGYVRSKNQLSTFPVNLEDLSMAFTLIEYENIGEVDPAYFESHPVDSLPIITHGLYFDGRTRKAAIGADDDRLDGKTGTIANRRNQLIGRPEQTMKVICQGLAEQHAWRKFLHFVRGSWGKFYVPTGTNDLPLLTDFSLGSSTMDLVPMGITSLLGNIAPRRDVKITIAGVAYYRRINSIVDNDTFETITLNSVIPGSGTVVPADVKVEWLTLSRIVGDTATFKHFNAHRSELRFGTRGVIDDV